MLSSFLSEFFVISGRVLSNIQTQAEGKGCISDVANILNACLAELSNFVNLLTK